ncbi:MAG: aldo/keto reductase, partial [Candidatus Binatus sp.]
GERCGQARFCSVALPTVYGKPQAGGGRILADGTIAERVGRQRLVIPRRALLQSTQNAILHRGNDFMSDADGLRYTKIPLNNGSDRIPALGFGTLIPDPIATKEAVRISLEAGFRQFDCAERYRNEEQVGEAMRAVFKEGKVKREDVFVGTKLWNNNHRPERVKPAFEASLKRLQLDYVDLYSTHTPFAFKPGDEQDPRDKNGNVIYDDATTLTNTWKALESLVDEGRCKAIGLSNVNLAQLKEVFEIARIKPAVVQVESHPYLPEWDLLNYCKKNGIVMQAFAALGHGIEPKLIDDPVITAIAKRVNKTPAQVLLAWAVQRGTAPLTTATSLRHIEENFDISTLPDNAIEEITQGISTRVRLNSVVATGIPGFIPKGR